MLYLKKAIKNLRIKINLKLVNNEKDYLKYTSKPRYMLHKIFYNNLVVIHKSKLALKLKTSEVLMYKFHYGYLKSQQFNTIIHRH